MAARVSGDERCRVKCRARWVNRLKPAALGLKVGGWTTEEDKRLHEVVAQLGSTNCWKAITAVGESSFIHGV